MKLIEKCTEGDADDGEDKCIAWLSENNLPPDLMIKPSYNGMETPAELQLRMNSIPEDVFASARLEPAWSGPPDKYATIRTIVSPPPVHP